MIGTDEIEHLVQLCIWSSYVKDERPVSMMLLSNVENGKTEILKKAQDIKGVLYLNDLTAWGLQHRYIKELANGTYNTIVIPDFITPLSKNADTADSLVTFLSGIIEEGTARIATYATPDLGLAVPVRCNIITAIAKEFVQTRRAAWTKIGFMSRLLPVSYDYSVSTKDAIHRYIAHELYQKDPPFRLNLEAVQPTEVSMSQEFALEIMGLSLQVANELINSNVTSGFRLHRQLHALAKASALSRGNTTVDEIDIEIIRHHSNFINFNYVKV